MCVYVHVLSAGPLQCSRQATSLVQQPLGGDHRLSPEVQGDPFPTAVFA